MKNLALFFVLIGLIAIAYFFEERGSENERLAKEQTERIFDSRGLGSLIGLKTSSFHLKRINNVFKTIPNERRVDQKKLEKVLEVLGYLKLKRVLDNEEIKDSFFPSNSPSLIFTLEKGEVSFVLGEKLPLDQSFYMQVIQGESKKTIIAYDSSPEKGVYNPEVNFKSDKKYLRLKSLMDLPKSFFYDNYIFGDRLYSNQKKHWKYAKISNDRNKPFGIDFEKLSTNPSPLKGLDYLKESFLKIDKELLSLRADKVIEKFERSKLAGPSGAIFFKDFDDKTEDLKLYKSYKNQIGYFIERKNDAFLYQISPGQAALFFLNAQELWDKRINLNLGDTEFSFKSKDESFKLLKSNTETFEVNHIGKGRDLAPSNIQFKKLFKVLNSQAKFVTNWNRAFDGPLLRGLLFSLDFPNVAVDVTFMEGEVILINKKTGYKLHYPVGKEPPFAANIKDYFLNK